MVAHGSRRTRGMNGGISIRKAWHRAIRARQRDAVDAPPARRRRRGEATDRRGRRGRGLRPRRRDARGARLTAATDWTCRVLAAGLEPAREYWYRFIDEQGNGSRDRPHADGAGERRCAPVRFAFVSCQNVNQGAQNAYRRMIHEDEQRAREEQLGFVLHLGDFIYEIVWYPEDRPKGTTTASLRDIVRYPNGEKIADFHLPTELEDYRTAYRGYLHDPDLQDARAHFPFVAMWDNHEFSWQRLSEPAVVRRRAASRAAHQGRSEPGLVRVPAGARHEASGGRSKSSMRPQCRRRRIDELRRARRRAGAEQPDRDRQPARLSRVAVRHATSR